MSLLPQHKKSAEEIAKLREDLGIPGDVPAAEPEVSAAPVAGPKPVHSLKKSEQIPSRPAPETVPPLAEPAPDPPPAHAAKPVRSLRKSEQAPVTPPEPPPDSKLPIHRHSDDEIKRIRRQEMIAMQAAPVVNPKLIAAHLGLVIPGYLFSIAGAVGFYYYDQPIYVTAACVAMSLIAAAYIFLKKPISQHHAAFISVIALLVIVFGALYYFPQLRHVS